MSSKRLAVEVENLSKRYLISHQEKHNYLGDALIEKLKKPFAKPEKEEFWALKDVSFNVEQGEVLGIVGRNGAGKSTMLKILSQIADPTEGEVRMHGKVGALLEVGTGFHPELTGRENIFLNGTILGLRKREVERRFDEIVDFAEIERFIDTPVKRYSSGMYVRLAFAIAANLDPEILIIDEVLAVGDARFQAKCLGKMQQVARGEGRTVLFVSHNATAVRSLCTKAVLLKGGRMEYFGDVETALSIYEDDSVGASTILGRSKVLNEGIVLEEITVNGSDAIEVDLGPRDTTLDIVVRGHTLRPLRARFGIYLSDTAGTRLAHFSEDLTARFSPDLDQGPVEWHARIELPPTLNEGTYYLSIDLSEHNVIAWNYVERAVQINKKGDLDPTGSTMDYTHYGMIMLGGAMVNSPALAQKSR